MQVNSFTRGQNYYAFSRAELIKANVTLSFNQLVSRDDVKAALDKNTEDKRFGIKVISSKRHGKFKYIDDICFFSKFRNVNINVN